MSKKKITLAKSKPVLKRKDFLSSGSCLLNLASSGKSYGTISKGKYWFIVGDSESGKTFLTHTLLAEASINSNFDDHRLIFDNAEDGALMDVEKFFGPKLAERIEPPAGTRDDPVHSSTIEEFYFHLDDAMRSGPVIYILDSMDVLSSQDEDKKFEQHRKAKRKLEETGTADKVAGSYGDGKAKKNSSNLRRAMVQVKKTGSILVIINQTRDNIGFGAQFNPKTRSGGHALKFYAHLETWLSVKEKLKRNVRGKNREIGVAVSIRVKKNRYTGKKRTVTLPIYYSHGFDDLGSCIDYLLQEKHWQKSRSGIDAKELGVCLSREQLIRWIEENNAEQMLHSAVTHVWNEIEAETQVTRKNRYQGD